jgi:hypothetical protein
MAGPGAREAFAHAWALARKDFVGTLLPPAFALLVAGSLNVGLSMLAGLVTGGAMLAGSGVGAAAAGATLAQAAMALPTSAVAAFFLAGIARFAARVARGEKPAFADVFSGAPLFVPAFVVTLVTMGVPGALSTLARLVPFAGVVAFAVVVLGGVVSTWALIAVERGLPAGAALADGWANVTAAPGQALLLMLFGGLGVLACCVGMFVTLPLLFVAVAYARRCRAGEPVAAV